MKERLLTALDDFMQLFGGHRTEGEVRNKEDDNFNIIVFCIIMVAAAVAVYLKVCP